MLVRKAESTKVDECVGRANHGHMRTGVDSGDDGPDTPNDPVTALAAVAGRRRQLSRDEEVAVRRARVAGLTWAEIGVVLGVSKQAIHKKYRKVG